MKSLKSLSLLIILILVIEINNISFATTGIVDTAAVRVREKASTDSKILTKIYEDEEFEILAEEGDWYKVSVNGTTGYVSKSLVKVKSESSSQQSGDGANNSTDTNNTNANTNSSTNSSNSSNSGASNSSENNLNNSQGNGSNEGNNNESNNINNNINNNLADNSTYDTESQNSENNTNGINNASSVSSENNVISKGIIKEDIYIKVLPIFASNNISLIAKDTQVTVSKKLGNWVEIFVGKNKGWILKTKVDITEEISENEDEVAKVGSEDENKTEKQNEAEKNETKEKEQGNTSDFRNSKGKINVETANVREKADKTSTIIYHLDEGDEVTIVSEEGDWYKITNSEVSSGYISKPLVTILNVSSRSMLESRQETVSMELDNTNDNTNNTNSNNNINKNSNNINSVNSASNGMEVVNYAKQYIGCSYVLGGKTPENGFDCSGFTKYVFKNFGYTLGSVAAAQNTIGTEVSRDKLKEGDLMLFYDEAKTKIGHTGIYIGGDQFIHAANPERGVVIDNFSTNSYYSSRFVTARRIVE